MRWAGRVALGLSRGVEALRSPRRLVPIAAYSLVTFSAIFFVVDPLAAELRKLFAADAAADKATHLALLAALYREAMKFVDNADVKTTGDLAARLRTASSSLLPAEAIKPIRQRIADEMAKHLPLDGDVPLDASLRNKATALFERIAKALEATSN